MVSKKLELFSTFEDVNRVVPEFLAFLKQQCQFTKDAHVFVIHFALRELLNNAVEHGNQMLSHKKIVCTLYFTKQYILIDVLDEGKGFDLGNHLASPRPDALQERTRGLWILQQMGFDLSTKKNHLLAKINHQTLLMEA